MINVFFINSAGEGFAENVKVESGTTASQLFGQKLGETAKPNDFKIRINRRPASANQILQDQDRVSVTPKKVAGEVS